MLIGCLIFVAGYFCVAALAENATVYDIACAVEYKKHLGAENWYSWTAGAAPFKVPFLPQWANSGSADSKTRTNCTAWKGKPRVDLWIKVGRTETHLIFQSWLHTVDLFWSPCYGNIVILADKNMKAFAGLEDLTFYLKRFVERHSEKIKLIEVDIAEVELFMPGKMQERMEGSKHYDFQQFLTFHADMHVDAETEVIAYMDSDAPFIAPQLPELLFSGKGQLFARPCYVPPGDRSFNGGFAETTNRLFQNQPNYKNVGTFMCVFPVFLWKSDIAKSREIVMQRFGKSDFPSAFAEFATTATSYPGDIARWYSQFDVLTYTALIFNPDGYIVVHPVMTTNDDYFSDHPSVTVHGQKAALQQMNVFRAVKTSLCLIYKNTPIGLPNHPLNCTLELQSYQRMLHGGQCDFSERKNSVDLRKKTSAEFFARVDKFLRATCPAGGGVEIHHHFCVHHFKAGWTELATAYPHYLIENFGGY